MKQRMFKILLTLIAAFAFSSLFQSCAPAYSSEYYNAQSRKYSVTSQHSECPGAYRSSSRKKRRR